MVMNELTRELPRLLEDYVELMRGLPELLRRTYPAEHGG